MEFRVLGPVQVGDGTAAVELAAGKQLALLACLLIARGAVVSRDRLIDALWGEQPPAAAVNGLQVHVHGLRRRLGADRVVRDGPGYRLHLEPGELDAERFERLAAQGRAQLGRREAAAAAASLREALALWRGPAYADLRYETFAQAEVVHLDELRLAALEDRLEADLDLGRHRELVPELEALVARHPGRERLYAHLMLALYRGDRQADALAVFQRAREAMNEALGIDPGPALQELQRAVLAQDAALALEPGDVRRHLPAPPTPLIGRASELAELAALLGGGARLVTLTGAGGIGKTRLALRAAHDAAPAFADGVRFADLSHLTDPALVPAAIANALELADQRGDAAAALRAFLAGRHVLLVLDNFEVVDSAAPLVGDLLRAAPGLVVLVTSRAPLRLSGEQQYRVEPLPLTEAVELFAARARAVAPEFRRPAEPAEEVAQLCRRLDCLPLAIELAAARTRDYAPRELLESVPGALELAGEGARDLPPRQRTLRATLDWSHRLLPADARATFARLAVFTGGCTADSAAAVCDAGRPALAALVSASLVRERAGAGGAVRWSMLESVREYALELGEADALRKRHAEHFAALAEAVEREHSANRSADAWKRLEAEQDNFRAALEWTRAAGAVALELRLVGALAYFWATSDHLRDGRGQVDAALRHADAPPALRARALVGAALVAHSLGDYERMRRDAGASLALFRELGDEPRTVLALNQLGIALSNLGDIDGGIACHEENAAISRRLGDGVRLSAALNNLGYCLLQRGAHDRATALFEEGLAECRRIGHRTGESVTLGNLGLAALLEQRPADALARYRDALLVDREHEYAEGLIYGVAGVAAALAMTDGAPRAARLLAAATTAARASGIEFEPLEAGMVARTEARLGGARSDAPHLDAAVDEALSAAVSA